MKRKYSKSLDMALRVLYNLKSDKGDNYYNLNQIIHNLDPAFSRSDMLEIGKYLEAQGYIKAEFKFGEVFANITSSGMVHIEDNPQEKDLSNLSGKVSSYDEQSEEELKKPIFALLDKMESILKKKRLNSTDIGRNLSIIRIELERENPDIDIIDIKIKSLEDKYFLRKYAQLIKEIFDF